MARKRKRYVRPQYVAKSERAKSQPKKPVPKELKYGLIFCACALVLAIILFFALYNDGSLPIRDGKAVVEADNWLVANTGTGTSPKYYKVGASDPIDGFTANPEVAEQMSVDMQYYEPDDENSQIMSYYVRGINRSPIVNAEAANSNYAMLNTEMVTSPLNVTTIDGREVQYFNSIGEPTEEQDGQQQFLAYLPSIRDTSVLVCITAKVTEEQPALDDAYMLEMLEQIISKVQFEEKK